MHQEKPQHTSQNRQRFRQIMCPQQSPWWSLHPHRHRPSKGLRLQSPNIQCFGPTAETTGTINELHPLTFDMNRPIMPRYNWNMSDILVCCRVRTQKNTLVYACMFFQYQKRHRNRYIHTHIYIYIDIYSVNPSAALFSLYSDGTLLVRRIPVLCKETW